MKIEQILVATDLTARTGVALAHAAALCRAFDAAVTLLHVDESADAYDGLVADELLAGYRKDLAQACQQQLTEQAQRLGLPPERVTTELTQGTPWRRVIAAVDRLDAELIIVTKPRGPEPALLGSTTKRIVRHAAVPVLVVDPAGYAAPPAAVTYRRLIYPTDFSDCAARGLPTAAELARRLEADLLLTHVMPVVAPLPRLGHHTLSPERLEQDLRRRTAAKLDKLAAGLAGPRVETLLLEGMNVAGALARAADEETDLLVIPSHGRGVADALLLGSTAERLLRVTPRPVLVLRRAFLERRAA